MKWFVTSEAQRFLRGGPKEEVAQRVFQWFRKHEGMKVNVKYEYLNPLPNNDTDIRYESESCSWVIIAPELEDRERYLQGSEKKSTIDKKDMMLTWEILGLGLRDKITLPERTFSKVDIVDDYKMVYKIGFRHLGGGEVGEGGLTGVLTEKDVEVWWVYTFSLEHF
jgi:hypothetical protein